MPKIVELRQDRGHINTNFDGYKLSLDSIPVLKQQLTSEPLKAEPNDEQYSLLHAELFAKQNLLIIDPWARTQSYFINCLGEIRRCSYDENKGKADEQQVVYRVLQNSTEDSLEALKKKGNYNFSLKFLSEKYCLLCDGNKSLVLLDTGNRLKSVEWKFISSCRIEAEDLLEGEKNYIIFDARLDIIQEQKQISIILGHVQRVESPAHKGASMHFLYLHWCKWTLQNDSWSLQILDTLEGKGSVYYCAFEPRAESVVISSNHEFKWRSKKSNDGIEDEQGKEGKPQLHGESEEVITDFSWSQTEEGLVIKFKIKAGKDKNDYYIKCESRKITVKCSDEILLLHELFENIEPDLTTWNIEDNLLEINLIKQTAGLLWLSLLANGAGPKETTDANDMYNLNVEQQPIANLEAPVEECDFPIDTNEEEITTSRFHLPTRSISHIIIMGSTPPLFSTTLRPGFPSALATRQDVDCCLWLQQYNPSKPEEWSMRHEGNLHAFGYVQASKQQKKFIDCSPDLGYVIIAESHRHIFLYKSKYDTASGLRNRNGPQTTVGKQHLITLEDAGEILGISTANTVATLLTEKYVLFLQIES